MDSLGNFGEILINLIKIFQFLSFLGNFDKFDDYDNLRCLKTPKKSASAQIFFTHIYSFRIILHFKQAGENPTK